MENLIQQFKSKYRSDPVIYRAPGRINLIGEHTDYNDGFVMPGAIHLELQLAVNHSDTPTFQFFSLALNQEDSCDASGSGLAFQWSVFFGKLIHCLLDEGYNIGPVNCVLGGNLPIGAGVSSSSALTCGFLFAMNDLFRLGMNKMDMVMIASRAEHGAGLRGGLMDQFSIVYGEKGKLILIDCKDMSFEHVTFENDFCKLWLVESGVSHNLIDSEYNLRRAECEEGLASLQSIYPGISGFRSIEQLHLKAPELTEKQKRRLTYILEENDRVCQAKQCIANGRWYDLGTILKGGHKGLKDLYEVTCEETDFIVSHAGQFDSVLGARQMGGGFGGSVILLAKRNAEQFKKEMKNEYKSRFNLDLAFHEVDLSGGISRV